MKIIIVGASGTLGRTAVNSLSSRHEIVQVGRNSGDVHADIADIDSIKAMYRETGMVDAVICATGTVRFGPIEKLSEDDFTVSLRSKMIPQVQLVLEGINYLNDGGSFTLTSGVSNRDPIKGGSAAAMVNGALDGFVVGAAVDMPRSIRINVVSPEALEASRGRHPTRFPGHVHVSDESVGLAYSKSVEGCLTGQVFIVD